MRFRTFGYECLSLPDILRHTLRTTVTVPAQSVLLLASRRDFAEIPFPLIITTVTPTQMEFPRITVRICLKIGLLYPCPQAYLRWSSYSFSLRLTM